MTAATRADAALPHPWGAYRLGEGEITSLRFGPRDLWLKRMGGEIWIADADSGAGVAGRVEPVEREPVPFPPDSARWMRWATAGDEDSVVVRPAFPDRALVLSPERPFRLLPRATARVFVRVPLWIRIELPMEAKGGGRTIRLIELPSLTMSDTWWGDFVSGELCYWLPTTARREMAPELFMPYIAVCPLLLTNDADTDLAVEKLSFRVAHLSLFAKEDHLWADESRVRYQGDELGSQIEMTGKPPPEATGAKRVAEPREPSVRGFRVRTFERLRGIPGLGGGG